MWLPLLGLVAGVLLGLVLRIDLPSRRATRYGIRCARFLLGASGGVDGHFEMKIFVTGFVTNAFFALLAFIGDRLGIDLYLVALASGPHLQNVVIRGIPEPPIPAGGAGEEGERRRGGRVVCDTGTDMPALS